MDDDDDDDDETLHNLKTQLLPSSTHRQYTAYPTKYEEMFSQSIT